MQRDFGTSDFPRRLSEVVKWKSTDLLLEDNISHSGPWHTKDTANTDAHQMAEVWWSVTDICTY